MFTDVFVSAVTQENFALTNIASIVAIGVLVLAPITYLIKRSWTIKKEREEVSKSLYEELTNGLCALDGTKGHQVMEITVKHKDKIEKKYYTLTFMNYDMYDSLIFSGKIQSLNHDLQQLIQDIYKRIKGHQEYLKYVIQLRDNAKVSNTIMDEVTTPYYELIANYELELEEMIPEAIKKLEKNF